MVSVTKTNWYIYFDMTYLCNNRLNVTHICNSIIYDSTLCAGGCMVTSAAQLKITLKNG